MAEKEHWQLSISVSKALNSLEAPLKIKHARLIIIATHQYKECNTLWKLLSTQPIMENRFSAWKFCHLLHKVLREGHSSCIPHSQSHKKMLTEMGKLWGHLDDLGTCIHAYSKLLVKKLDFHHKNSLFPGSFAVSIEDFERYSGDDINVYFQLCVEIFDYLDDILNLQSCVFQSVNSYRMFSMSSAAQCRLAPLITLIQDSNPLYDFCVRIMFKLHESLQADLLSGHRSRFKEIFTNLKMFYEKVRPLQYFEDLIQVPFLPETAPNFSSRVDFGNYVPPVVTVPEIDNKPVLENLVDLSLPRALEELSENEKLKEHLQDKNHAIEIMENEILTLKENSNIIMDRYKMEINDLTRQLNTLKTELVLSKEICEKTHKQTPESHDLIQRNLELEELAKNMSEKFNKFKTMYSQTREEHINLLRQSGESNKLLIQEKTMNKNLKSENHFLQERIAELVSKIEINEYEKKRMEESLETSSLDIDRYNKERTGFQKQIENLKSLGEEAVLLKRELAYKNDQINEAREEILRLKKDAVEIRKEADKKLSSYEGIVDSMNSNLNAKTIEIENLNKTHKLQLYEESLKLIEAQKQLEELNLILKKKEYEYKEFSENCTERKKNLDAHIVELQKKCDKAYEDINLTLTEKMIIENQNKHCVELIIKNLISTAAKTFNRAHELTETSTHLVDEIINSLDLLYEIDSKNYMDEGTVGSLIQSIFSFLSFLAMLQGFTYKNVTDIRNGDRLWNIIQSIKGPVQNMFSTIQFKGTCLSIEKNTHLGQKLLELKQVLSDLSKDNDSNLDLAERMKSELADMEKTIADATNKFIEMLRHTKSKDDGIKLKVNEKILDACTNLMECIKTLIKRSKALQEEIVMSGQGNASVREFYKRNSEWTEGLISAAKSIAKGANFLVAAANNAIIEESSNNNEIIVASQEIAAYTAQLVIASKVKAHKDSIHLQELTAASRSVSLATGAVVAIVKDCIEEVELHNEVDVLKLTSSQAKTVEMNIQVKVLELEQALQVERQKLASFRKNLYKNSET